MRFAKNTHRDTSEVLRMPRRMTTEVSKVLRLPRKMQLNWLWWRRVMSSSMARALDSLPSSQESRTRTSACGTTNYRPSWEPSTERRWTSSLAGRWSSARWSSRRTSPTVTGRSLGQMPLEMVRRSQTRSTTLTALWANWWPTWWASRRARGPWWCGSMAPTAEWILSNISYEESGDTWDGPESTQVSKDRKPWNLPRRLAVKEGAVRRVDGQPGQSMQGQRRLAHGRPLQAHAGVLGRNCDV